MRQLWTRDGRPLLNSGNDVMTADGTPVGRIRGDWVFTPDDDYVGTLVGDRLVFRSFDREGPYRAYRRPASPRIVESVAPAHMWGDEPSLPD